MRLLHSIAKTSACFHDPNLISDVGLVPLMGLAERAGLHDSAAASVGFGGIRAGAVRTAAYRGLNLAHPIPGSAPRIVDVYDTYGTVYAVGEGVVSKTMQAIAVLVYNGHTWARMGQVTAAAAVPNQISGDGGGGVWFPLIDAQASGSAAVGHYVSSIKRFGVTDLPGSILSIARVDRTFELAAVENT